MEKSVTVDITSYSPLVLAYIGDGVYELVIRTMVVEQGNTQVNKMHKKTTSLVKAETQARMMRELTELLSAEELAVYKRGRNAKAVTMAKHATMADYRTATGFEALMGYLYLTKQNDRMMELIRTGIDKIEGNWSGTEQSR